jgi:hypothetical protein
VAAPQIGQTAQIVAFATLHHQTHSSIKGPPTFTQGGSFATPLQINSYCQSRRTNATI